MPTECANCYITSTSQWRHGYCNCCYLHYKKYNKFKDVSEIYGKILLDISRGKIYS
jgi:hypothetical protein